MKRFFLIFTCLILVSCVLLTACGDKNKGNKTDDSTGNKETTAQTTGGNKDTDAATDGDTKDEDTTNGEIDGESSAESETEDDTTDAETDAKEENKEDKDEEDKGQSDDDFVPPRFTNPLTGLPTLYDITKKRPVSIIVNNIGVSLPQEGISQADVLYECLAEGGITRLMMITTYYDEFKKVGSIRSARDYFIDYSDGYNAIFVHAGGSPYAYDTIANRWVNNIDAVNGDAAFHYTFGTFERDPERMQKFALEHTLVLKSGQGLVNAIAYMGYNIEKAAGYEEPFKFADFRHPTVLDNEATHAKVVMSNYQTVDFVYDEEIGKYRRYQYNGQPHIDGSTGEQLSFKNVILIFTSTYAIPCDDKARIDVGTTGTGSGWFMTDGTYQRITWRKDSATSILRFYYEDGTEVELNRGKTMINVVPSYNEYYVTFDNNWN